MSAAPEYEKFLPKEKRSMNEVLCFITDLFSKDAISLNPDFAALCAIAFLMVWTWTAIHFMSGETDIQIRRRK